MEIPFGLFILFSILFLYLLPTLIAFATHHRFLGGIFVVNFFLGWTLLGWVGALAWSVCYSPSPAETGRA
jgi:hypothetical protein